MLIKHCLLLFVFLNLVQPILFAQQSSNEYIISKRLLSVEEGLASREVLCGLQDKYGFNWFGTRNGLNRYDGKNFLLFSRLRNGMQGNKVLHLAHDNNNLLFIEYGESSYHRRVNGMVDVMNLSTLKVQSLTQAFPNLPFKEKDVTWIANDGTNKLSFITANPFRLWYYSTESGFTLRCEMKEWNDSIDNKDALPGPSCIFFNGKAALVYRADEACYYLLPGKEFTFRSAMGGMPLPFLINAKDELLFSYNNYQSEQKSFFGVINKYGEKTMPVDAAKYNLSDLNGENFEATQTQNNVSTVVKWFANGVYVFSNNELIQILSMKDIALYKDIFVFETFADQEGKQWICTSIGVIEIKIKENRFRHYFTRAQQQIEENNQARGIYADTSGKVYANIWETLFVQDENGTKSTNIKGDPAHRKLLYSLSKHQGNLYLGGYFPSIYTEKNNHIKELPNNYNLEEIWSMYPFQENILLLGRNLGIELYNIKTKRSSFVTYSSPLIPKALFVYRFFKSKDGTLWAVAENGLFAINNKGVVIDYYGEKTTASHQLPFSNLGDACEDKNGNFWLATNGEGLIRWNRKTNQFKQFNITDGLPSDILYRIEMDEKDNLWISSDYGLIKFNTQNNTARTYTIKDGLSHNEFNRISSYKGPDNRLYFGGMDGVNAFYPQFFWQDTVFFNAPLQVISYSTFTDKDGLVVDISNEINSRKEIEIHPDDKFFSLEFMLLDYEEERHQYAYKIEGIDKDWNYINENAIRLSGLPHGQYTLHIKGQNQSGQWSSKELSIPINVLTPFYQKTWFIVFVTIGLLAIIFAYIKYRTGKLSSDKEKLEHIVSQRTEQLKDLLEQKDMMVKEIHHRVKNNLQIISSLLEIQGIRSTDENIKAVIAESQNRVLSIAFIHKNLYQQDSLKGVEIVTFVKELTHHVSTVFSNLDHRIVVENHIEDIFLDIDTAVPLGLIINELMTNSFKYAFKDRDSGFIKIALVANGQGNYSLSYMDDGKGLPENIDLNSSKTLGLRLIKQLSKQLGGTMKYSFNKGSMFELELKDMQARLKTT